jgi:MFS transporter, MHS family, citrate/tricarballylate:H+ symporter
MAASRSPVGTLEEAHLPLRKVLAVAVGNALEFYDFLTFSYFAIQIGHTFFPASQTSHGLLLSLATFGVGFITRPLGALLIGHYGDRVGRRPAMLWSFGLMGFGLLGMALTPPYARIGIAAPVLLVFCRLVQGLAVGGEVGASTAFLVEAAPLNRRGYYVSLQFSTQYVAVLAAGVVGFILSEVLSPAQLDAWGWRVALLIGVTVIPLGLYMRRSLHETLKGSDEAAGSCGPRRLGTRFVVLSLLLVMASTMTVYVVGYMNLFVQDTLGLSAHFGFGATIVESLCVICTAPAAGLLSDRLGRKPVMLTAAGLLLLLVVPCYIAIISWRSMATVYGATGLFGVLEAFMIAPLLTSVSESLPRAVRATGFGLLYAVSVAVFGGFTQFAINALMDLTGSPLAPAAYLTVALLVGGSAMLAVRESAPCRASTSAGAGPGRNGVLPE